MEALIILLALLFGAVIAIGLAVLGMQLLFAFVSHTTPVTAGSSGTPHRSPESPCGTA